MGTVSRYALLFSHNYSYSQQDRLMYYQAAHYERFSTEISREPTAPGPWLYKYTAQNGCLKAKCLLGMRVSTRGIDLPSDHGTQTQTLHLLSYTFDAFTWGEGLLTCLQAGHCKLTPFTSIVLCFKADA